MTQTLFRSWFVDFEPVIAKREGRKPVGMDDCTAALFPEHFQDTDLGPTPAGWEPTAIGNVVEIVKGRSYASCVFRPKAATDYD